MQGSGGTAWRKRQQRAVNQSFGVPDPHTSLRHLPREAAMLRIDGSYGPSALKQVEARMGFFMFIRQQV